MINLKSLRKFKDDIDLLNSQRFLAIKLFEKFSKNKVSNNLVGIPQNIETKNLYASTLSSDEYWF